MAERINVMGDTRDYIESNAENDEGTDFTDWDSYAEESERGYEKAQRDRDSNQRPRRATKKRTRSQRRDRARSDHPSRKNRT